MPNLMICLDKNGIILDFDAPGENFFTKPISKIVNQHYHKVIPNNLIVLFAEKISLAHKTNNVLVFTFSAKVIRKKKLWEAHIFHQKSDETMILIYQKVLR
ncbi:hypothetical protein A2Y99_02605 [Candidatus Gottesmanbacteria bacterium RBG_13_37_7]|uniref:PAS fold-2 domain-containing protein n=1 Tax=Candidatus Gottesmanbacteria bacterium RBG_13_37_7 TaxID=1798369 RepID=A0A1F5YGZ0_9BACT|nr:MAG: hypothetical protein A2Y99_02605 [Candidatus Gottesmanbacteria bacterium RBG_13_37_7]